MRLRQQFSIGLAVLSLSSLGFAGSDASDPKIRDAAQRGVNFLSASTAQWVTNNNCFGCHVEAVTLEGLSVGKSHQYTVSDADLKQVLKGMLTVPGGARNPGGVSHPSFPRTAKAFAGSAFARYDALVDSKLTDDLLNTAKELLAFQETDGSVKGDYSSAPVAPPGVLQMSFQAAQTWRQAYGRTGDAKWLAPLRNAEGFFLRTAKSWHADSHKATGAVAPLQDVNYVLLGLLASGMSVSDDEVSRLVTQLRKQQREDGGWSFDGSTSNPFATGQTVYALRQASLSESDDSVKKGLNWLVAHQAKDGSWGAAGSGKAEAMWAVMGLVSVDVMSVAIKGVQDGTHVAPTHELTISADDNKGGKVAKLELLIDDKPVLEVKTNSLTYTWKTEGLSTGPHTLDGIATNEKGQKSRRRIEVFAGDVYFSQLGTRFTNEGTQVTLRGVQTVQPKDTFKLRVRSADMKTGTPAPGDVVYETTLPAAMGPIAFIWSGKNTAGKAQAGGRYFAEVSFVNSTGASKQSESTLFMHADEAAENQYAKVSGSLGMKRDGSGASNADVELVDDEGRVVQRTRSNDQGNYMFKTVDPGKYKVRLRKAGFADQVMPVQAAPAAESKASASF